MLKFAIVGRVKFLMSARVAEYGDSGADVVADSGRSLKGPIEGPILGVPFSCASSLAFEFPLVFSPRCS